MLLISWKQKNEMNELQIERKSRADSKAFGKWFMNASKSAAIGGWAWENVHGNAKIKFDCLQIELGCC